MSSPLSWNSDQFRLAGADGEGGHAIQVGLDVPEQVRLDHHAVFTVETTESGLLLCFLALEDDLRCVHRSIAGVLVLSPEDLEGLLAGAAIDQVALVGFAHFGQDCDSTISLTVHLVYSSQGW